MAQVGRGLAHTPCRERGGSEFSAPCRGIFFVVLLPLLDISLPFGEHVIHEAGQLVCSSRNGFGFVHSGAESAVIGP
jgi:hypothetical protein